MWTLIYKGQRELWAQNEEWKKELKDVFAIHPYHNEMKHLFFWIPVWLEP